MDIIQPLQEQQWASFVALPVTAKNIKNADADKKVCVVLTMNTQI